MIECLPKSKAVKRYTQRTIVTMSAYLVLVFVTTYLVRHEHLPGWLLYVCAVVPSLAVLRMLHVVALYLKEEKDEFVRQQTVNSLLWATAAILALTAFTDFLRSYTPFGTLPPFTVFVAFWIVFGLASTVQTRESRVTGDE
jgi:hypothetical protein